MSARKILVMVITLVVVLVLLAGCGISQNNNDEQPEETEVVESEMEEFGGLILIDDTYAGGNIRVYRLYDPETLVMYVYLRQGHNAASQGGISIMYNADGTPKLYNTEE